jgi:F0F1-type ATP synthase delta subunit
VSEESTKTTLHNPDELRGKPRLCGRIISGMPLSIAARKRIVRSFETMLGCHVTLSCRVDRKLIAGVRVELGGRAYDGTLKGQLANVRKMLTRHDEEEL